MKRSSKLSIFKFDLFAIPKVKYRIGNLKWLWIPICILSSESNKPLDNKQAYLNLRLKALGWMANISGLYGIWGRVVSILECWEILYYDSKIDKFHLILLNYKVLILKVEL